MKRGGTFLLAMASVAVAACAAQPNGVEIRAIADPSSKLRGGSDRLADARGQLALGNVGLALEGFRKAARERPDDAEAYAGMAACYDAMGRYDLAQSNYEAALALEPRSTALLAGLAGALERQGKREAAAGVRAEVAQIHAAARALEETQAEPMSAVAVAVSVPTIAVAATALKSTVTAAVAAPRPPIAAAIAKPAAPAAKPAVPVAAPAPKLAFAPSAAQVTVALPAARPIAVMVAAPVAEPVPQFLPPEVMVAAAPAPAPSPTQAAAPAPAPRRALNVADILAHVDVRSDPLAPRLQRLSPGEVALVTEPRAVWRGKVVSRSARSVTVRWVPLTMASARPNIRLFNAARRQGLAARTREYLLGRGWRKIEIGDWKDVRNESVVLYPVGRQATARSLAAQFGIRARPIAKGNVLVVLLGRDSVRAAQTRG